MRRRLVVVALATTGLIVISLVVPLGLLVRQQAADRARVATERETQSASALIALVVALDTSTDAVESVSDQLADGVIVVLDDGTTYGEPVPGQGVLVESAREARATITSIVEGGWEIALPVIGASGVVVVDGFATAAELSEGVWEAWILLLVLAVLLVALAVLVADRLGRRMVEPMRELAGAAHLMSEGDLDARVETRSMSDVPGEIVEVGEAFNTLASRLDELLAEEREAAANLSHRLRTPLTSLRLQAENVGDPDDKRQVLAQVDRLELAIDRLILASRTRVGAHIGACELDAVAADRAAFWRVLAEEQERSFELSLGAGEAELGVSFEEIGVLIDTLIGNVFAHTPPGTGFQMATGEEGARLWLSLTDEGPGFVDKTVVARGASGVGSTGLGLDIVRRTAEMTGGHIELDDRPGGGAVVRVWFG